MFVCLRVLYTVECAISKRKHAVRFPFHFDTDAH